MKKINRYILIAVIVYLAGSLLQPLASQYIYSVYVTFSKVQPWGDIIALVAQVLLSVVKNAGFAYWLFAEKAGTLWALLGLIFGLPGVILHYLVKHFEGKKGK